MSLFVSLQVTRRLLTYDWAKYYIANSWTRFLEHPATITIGLLWLLQATTEQAVFIGLFMCTQYASSVDDVVVN